MITTLNICYGIHHKNMTSEEIDFVNENGGGDAYFEDVWEDFSGEGVFILESLNNKRQVPYDDTILKYSDLIQLLNEHPLSEDRMTTFKEILRNYALGHLEDKIEVIVSASRS
jgi:hypothetical protein